MRATLSRQRVAASTVRWYASAVRTGWPGAADAPRTDGQRRNGTSAPARVHDDTDVPVGAPSPGHTRSDGTFATTAANRVGSVEASNSAYSAPLAVPTTPTRSPDTSGRSASHCAAESPYSSGMRVRVF